MDRIEAMESLLPGFQEFLADLALINLTSGIRQKVENYQRNIQDYIDQHSTAPSAPLPPLPVPTNSGPIDLAKQREESWRMSKGEGALHNEYQNTNIGGKPPEDLYEEPVRDIPPKLPSIESRPPIKRIIDAHDSDVYEDPDDSTTESGRGSMPPGSCSDEGSGSTFFFSHGRDKTEPAEEDFNSDSTEFEEFEEEDQQMQEKPKKAKVTVNKLQEFIDEHKSEEDIDLIDKLHVYNTVMGTIGRVNFPGKWEKRYCIAKDGQIFLFKNYKDKQAKAQKFPLMGYEVWPLGQQSGKDHVFRISHHSMKHPLLLAADSKATSDKWVAVLKRYATIDHTIMPTQGISVEQDDTDDSPEKKKGGRFFSKEKKEKIDATPQLTLDSSNTLSGYVNVYGAKYGEAKVKRKWISIQDMAFSCSASKDDPILFTFSMKGIQIQVADKKEVKMKGAFKLIKDGEVYLYLEALNMIDAGQLLKKLVSSSIGKQPNKEATSGVNNNDLPDEHGMVARLLAAFETSSNDQADGNQSRRSSALSIPTSPTIKEEMCDNSGALSSSDGMYENSKIMVPPQDSSARRKSWAEMFTKKRPSVPDSLPLYENALSELPVTDELYDDVITVSPTAESAKEKKTMSLPMKKQTSLPERVSFYEDASSAAPAPDELYDDVIATTPPKTAKEKKTMSLPNFKGNKKDKDKEKDVTSTLPDPEAEKKETEKERKAREKKQKKEKEKKDKEEKKKKKKEKEAEEARKAEEERTKKAEEEKAKKAEEEKAKKAEEEKASLATSAPASVVSKEEAKKSPNLQRKQSALNKFKDSGMSHLLLKDKLMLERKELETKKKELTVKRTDIREKKNSSSDPAEKEKLQKEMDAVQKELSEISKKLVKVAAEIEGATGEKKNEDSDKTGSAVNNVGKGSVRASSPDRQVSKGTVSDRMKMFQQGN